MSEKHDLSDLSDEELVAELTRRRAEGRLELDNLAFELSTEADARREGARAMSRIWTRMRRSRRRRVSRVPGAGRGAGWSLVRRADGAVAAR
ncbi:MAG TPA: hypothetical protein VIK60_09165 [Vicinamibacterales bacterium]